MAVRSLRIGLSTLRWRAVRVVGVSGSLQEVVGENIRRMRRETGRSQEALADEIGYHRTWVGAVERGERNITMQTLERLAELLKVHPFDLLWDHHATGVDLRSGGVIRYEAPAEIVDDEPHRLPPGA